MTPWYCPSLFRQSAPCGGKADAWLQTMEDQIVPEVERVLGEVPAYRAVVGYSLGGLFALYALYRTELFSASASVSGSLWYPSFREYVSGHVMRRRPDCIYISLGDREARTRHPLMRTVKEKTEQIAGDFRRAGIETALEWNRGNHAQDAEERTVKGIRWLLMHGKDSRGEAEN